LPALALAGRRAGGPSSVCEISFAGGAKMLALVALFLFSVFAVFLPVRLLSLRVLPAKWGSNIRGQLIVSSSLAVIGLPIYYFSVGNMEYWFYAVLAKSTLIILVAVLFIFFASIRKDEKGFTIDFDWFLGY
jgi:hypothetical protein